MYRVVLVDDEAWSLESIINLIDWELLGFEIDRSFTDSEDALEYIRSKQPHVVFTDVRMPALSGLQLMKKTHEYGLGDIFFVVVSGYGEFEYAREALRLGAYDYCLKPVDPASLEDLLGRLRLLLDDARIRRDTDFCLKLLQPSGGAEQLAEQSPKQMPEQLAERSPEQLSEQLSERSPKQMPEHCGSRFSGSCWQAIILLDRLENSGGHEFSPDLAERDCLLLHLGPRKMLLLLNAENDIEARADSLLATYDLDARFLVGISRPQKNKTLKTLAPLIHEAEIAACQYFIDPSNTRGRVYFSNKTFNIVKGFASNIEAYIDDGDFRAAAEAIDRLPGLLMGNNLNMRHVEYVFNEIVSIFVRRFNSEAAKENYMDYNQLVSHFSSCAALSEYLKNIVISHSEQSGLGEDSVYISMAFRKLLKYVDEHYAEPLSMKELAHKYYIGFSYCCFLFKKATNKTFNEYLLDKRMATAYELLRLGECSISGVAERAGYSDQYYFCKKFKKYFGFAPSRIMQKTGGGG